ncbi:uncharacterized protein [Battus philenor]|uniref:uncharacterized protein n=1 Tax=Battus philenor TaxID=42288 RepID=UPI0035CF71A1
MANEENENKGSDEHVLNRVAVKVPPFYAAKPKLWFATLESQFVLANITSDATKYHHAVSQLEPQYAEIVEDIVEGPASTNKYETLKNELIKRLSASRERQVQQLLHHEELGDSKPSQFLRRLKSLAGSGVPDDLLRTLWASRLPSSVQPIIASQAKMTLDEVAELADQVLDAVSPTSQVAGISGTSSGGSSEIAALTRQVQVLTEKVDRMSRSKSKNRNFSKRRGRSSASSTRSHSNYRKFPICWYHSKFADSANKCVKPCDFTGNAKGSR